MSLAAPEHPRGKRGAARGDRGRQGPSVIAAERAGDYDRRRRQTSRHVRASETCEVQHARHARARPGQARGKARPGQARRKRAEKERNRNRSGSSGQSRRRDAKCPPIRADTSQGRRDGPERRAGETGRRDGPERRAGEKRARRRSEKSMFPDGFPTPAHSSVLRWTSACLVLFGAIVLENYALGTLGRKKGKSVMP